MKRREFFTLLGSAVAWPLMAHAQQTVIPVIGYMDTASASTTADLVQTFRRGLSVAGFDDGRKVAIEYRWADGNYDKLPALATELVRRQVAVIATVNTPTILAAKAATQTIPIVFGVGVDPIKFGLVASLSHPGGNLTGVTQLNVEIEAKHVQLLHDLVPAATSMGLLINRASVAYSEAATETAQNSARVLGLRLLVLNASTESAIEAAFATLIEERAGSLLVSGDSFLVSKRNQLVALAAQHAVPALYHRREFTVIGGLMSYGPSLPEVYYQVGDYTGRILKGAKPADLPVQQSTKFELVINAKTAKALGIEIPISIQTLADEVIE
ncbi:MAG: ABC transporter substrate-binding protein [Hyphomicrobiales bacterium]|nr:ABC transporter substrate-binding protein [Hyphomicrobiales bacterium]